MQEESGFFQQMLSVLVVFILPLWLILHYRSRNKLAERGLDPKDLERLEQLRADAERMKQRIQILEQILDEKAPEWRKQR